MAESTGHRSFWDGRVEREAGREEEDPRKRAHTDLLWRAIRRVVGESPRRILDAGAGTGRFSIPLAVAGHEVVHHDISRGMIAWARAAATEAGVTGIDFVEGDIVDLSRFPDRAFDVTLCLDSPLSFCANRHGEALDELVRVTGDALVLCTMNRGGTCLEDGGRFDLDNYGKLATLPTVLDTGTLDVTEELLRRVPTLVPTWHAFRPDEIAELLEERAFRPERVSAIGNLPRFSDPEQLTRLYDDADGYAAYLDVAERFDDDPDLRGLGASRGGGLLAVARRAS